MKKALSILFLTILGTILFLLTLRGTFGNPQTPKELYALSIETGPFESSHERAPYAEMLAIKNHGTIELGKELADFASPDVGHKNNQFYSFFPSGVSYTSLLFYSLGQLFNAGLLAVFSSSAVFSMLTMIFIFLICVEIFNLPYWTALLSSITFAFATTSWSYSITIYQHAAAAFFVVFLFYTVWKYKQTRNSWKEWIWGSLFWTMLGLSLFFDYPNAIILAPLPIYLFISAWNIDKNKTRTTILFRSSFFITSLLFFAFVFLNGYRNYIYFGNWASFGNSLPRYAKAQETTKKIEEVANQTKKKQASEVLREERIPKSSTTLLFGIDKGIFLYSPIVLLAVLGILSVRKRLYLEYAVLLSLILSNFFVYASFGDPWGGWAYGPRYLIPLMSISSIFIAVWIAQKKLKRIRKVIFYILFLASSAIALAGPLTTNLIPPKVEADYLKFDFYNFMRAFDLIAKGKTSNFVFNTYLSGYVTLQQYFFIIWGTLLGIVALLLFVVPLFEKHEPDDKH